MNDYEIEEDDINIDDNHLIIIFQIKILLIIYQILMNHQLILVKNLFVQFVIEI